MSGIHAFWRRLDRPGHEAARFARAGSGWVLEGYAAFSENGPTGVRYEVMLAPDFSTIRAQLAGHRSGIAFRHEFRRAQGEWMFDGRVAPGLGGLEHLDFGFTPSTNLPQLLRADLGLGEEADIPAAWFDIGCAALVRLPQHYQRTAADRYRYRSPTTGYEATLEMAASGFVRLYPDLWEMEVEPGS